MLAWWFTWRPNIDGGRFLRFCVKTDYTGGFFTRLALTLQIVYNMMFL
jgi:hypothetical protein